MKSKTQQRASRDEIINHLSRLLGKQAENVVVLSAQKLLEGEKERGLSILYEYDSSLGGVGIYAIKDKKPLGVYRALFYVWLPLQGERPEDFTRSMIHNSCVYLEELLKKIVRVWVWEKFSPDSLPLGTLINRARTRLPSSIYDDLSWLNSKIYNPAKHNLNLEKDGQEEPEHYFELDEAIAIYFVARKLGLEIEGLVDSSVVKSWWLEL
jgi:hypothetical protein